MYLIYILKLLVLLDPSVTFQDTRMRKSVPPEEIISDTVTVKRKILSFLVHFLLIIVLSGIYTRI